MNAKTIAILQEYDQWLAERRGMANRELDTPSLDLHLVASLTYL